MSRASVRAGIVSFLSTPQIAGLAQVYPSYPGQLGEQALGLSAGNGSGAYAIVDLGDDSEVRIAVGGLTAGIKHVTYKVMIGLFFASFKPALQAMADYDTLLDALKARIRSDRTLGGSVWQAGEGAGDLHTAADVPRANAKGGLTIWSALSVDVIEEIVS